MSTEIRYDGYYPIVSEGGRIALATCERCGAAVILDGVGDEAHDKWHEDVRNAAAVALKDVVNKIGNEQ